MISRLWLYQLARSVDPLETLDCRVHVLDQWLFLDFVFWWLRIHKIGWFNVVQRGSTRFNVVQRGSMIRFGTDFSGPL